MRNGTKKAIFFILILCVGQSYAQDEATRNTSTFAFRFQANDSVEVNVELRSTEYGYPMGYAAHLETEVCSDGLCKPVSITIHWDMLGQFTSYHTTDQHTLTKFDHIPFTAADHKQLHRILSDTTAVLRDYNVEDMIDTSVFLPSQQIDAVTRPTSLTFSAATVEGALYTVYTLWHFTNGAIRSQIKSYTRSLMMEDRVLKSMLASEKRDYVRFVFQNLSSEQHKRLSGDIVRLVGSNDTYIPHFALAQLSDNTLSLASIQQQLLVYFSTADNPLKNAILDRLMSITIGAETMVRLLTFIPHLQEQQGIKVLMIVDKNIPRINSQIYKQLEALSENENPGIVRQVKNVLQKIN
jgi:hypothetical protein